MSASTYKDKGNKHLQAGEFDLAIEAYSQAIRVYGKCGKTRKNCGKN